MGTLKLAVGLVKKILAQGNDILDKCIAGSLFGGFGFRQNRFRIMSCAATGSASLYFP